MAIKSGWVNELIIKYKFNIRSLLDIVKRHTPVGKSRQPGFVSGKKYYTYKKAYMPGKLRRDWKLDTNYISVKADGKGLMICNPSIVAHVQEFGAKIPEKFMPKGKYMMFGAGGGGVFASHRRAFTIKGQHFVRRAVNEWLNQDDSIEAEWE